MAEHLRSALQAMKGVHWAEVNGVLGRVVVAFEEGEVDPDELVDLVAEIEEAHAVSYTHLDVYKRQWYGCSAGALANPPVRRGSPQGIGPVSISGRAKALAGERQNQSPP